MVWWAPADAERWSRRDLSRPLSILDVLVKHRGVRQSQEVLKVIRAARDATGCVAFIARTPTPVPAVSDRISVLPRRRVAKDGLTSKYTYGGVFETNAGPYR